jgi:hypothetical protein
MSEVQEKTRSYIYVNSQYAFFELVVLNKEFLRWVLNPDRANVVFPAGYLLECSEWVEQGKFMYQKIWLI